MSAHKGMGRHFSPLDKALGLGPRRWSSGAERVMIQHGLHGPSFEEGAALFSESVGLVVSGESVRQVTEGWGKRVAAKRGEEAEALMAGAMAEEAQVQVQDSLTEAERVNVSSDGGMVRLREEGWRECKMCVYSEVVVKEVEQEGVEVEGEETRLKVHLRRHSYQAGIWEAETFAKYQYAEGVRRGVQPDAQKMSSVNDGALWIERVTRRNYPQATLILDWAHVRQHLSETAESVFGAESEAGKAWCAAQEEELWYRGPEQVLATLQRLAQQQRGNAAQAAQQTYAYLASRREMLAYDSFRAEGYPLGSGTVESGILTGIHRRMKRQGRGWRKANAQGMLAALSELQSGRFQTVWRSLAAS